MKTYLPLLLFAALIISVQFDECLWWDAVFIMLLALALAGRAVFLHFKNKMKNT